MTRLLTLRLDDAATEVFEGLRRWWFPPERNVVPAHVMLFHALPDDATVEVDAAPFPVEVTRVRSLGRGVAYDLASPVLQRIRAELARGFDLSPQDRQPYRPHVTVQNKVTADTARSTLAALAADFAPWTCTAIGLDLWTYRDGPWEAVSSHPFTS